MRRQEVTLLSDTFTAHVALGCHLLWQHRADLLRDLRRCRAGTAWEQAPPAGLPPPEPRIAAAVDAALRRAAEGCSEAAWRETMDGIEAVRCFGVLQLVWLLPPMPPPPSPLLPLATELAAGGASTSGTSLPRIFPRRPSRVASRACCRACSPAYASSCVLPQVRGGRATPRDGSPWGSPGRQARSAGWPEAPLCSPPIMR